MSDAFPNRSSGDVPTQVRDNRIPWTVICVGCTTLISVMTVFRTCGPVDVGWKFAEKSAVEAAAAKADMENVAAHNAIQLEIGGIGTELKEVRASTEAINATIRDEILTRLPETKRKRGVRP